MGFSDSFVLQGHGVSPSCKAVWLCLHAVAAAAAAAANFLQVFCSLSRVSDVTLESFLVGFSDSFVLQGHGVSPCGRAVWPCFCAVAAAAAAANFLQVFCFVSRVSDVTLESFWVGFSDSFVLQGHGVSPSGRAVWPCFCAVAAAAAANFLQVFCSVSRSFSSVHASSRFGSSGILAFVRHSSGHACFSSPAMAAAAAVLVQ